MDVRDLDLPARFRDHYADAGIEELYPPQAAAVEAGVTAGESVVAAVPTASGKTLIAELAMLSTPGTALYVVPLRALADEKHRTFAERPGIDVGIATGDYDSPPADLGDNDVIVATSEKVDSLIRHGADWLSELGCVAVDEIHLLHSADRGPTLEVTVAKLRELNPGLGVVGLSATVANPDAIADWLDAALVETDWRPVDLRRGIYHDGRIAFEDGDRAVEPGGDPTRALIRDVLADGGQCLVFVHSRRAAEDLAEAFAAEWLGTASGAADEIGASARTDTGQALAGCVRDGVAFHHAGLRPEHRTAVERAFREREIDVICATPTLAAGVNIPARRVIVRDHERYTDNGRQPLDVLEVHQMFGRAGRPGLDPYGEAVLVAESEGEADALRERYLEGEPEAVASKLASQEALRTHVLATIASGFAATRAELLGVLEGTFYATREDREALVDVADLVLDELDREGMLRRDDGLEATELGAAVSRLYVDPRTAAGMLDALRAAADLESASALTALEIVCDTPDMGSFYLRNRDWSDTYNFASANEAAFTKSVDGFEGAFDDWLRTVKVVRVLADWIDGEPEDAITDRHGIGPGDLRTKVERAEWLLNAAATLAEREGIDALGAVRAARDGLAEREA